MIADLDLGSRRRSNGVSSSFDPWLGPVVPSGTLCDPL